MRNKGYLGAYLRRQKTRLGAPKAITATAHKLARIVYHLMRFGVEYVKKDEAAYAEQVRDRLEKSLRRRAKELGFEATKLPATATVTVSSG
jgi:transposase